MGSFEHHQDSRIRLLHTRRAPAARRHRFRPRLEDLEGRTVLSAYTAATVADLIADINASNQAGGSNTITFAAPTTSLYVLTAVDNYTDGATGLPVIAAHDNLTIVGNGDTIARSTATGTLAFRVIDVAAGASLTLKGGLEAGGLPEGGAIFNQGGLVLNGAHVQANTAQSPPGYSARGGGIYSSGSLTLEGGSTIQNNQALGYHGLNARWVNTRAGRSLAPALAGADAFGGGIYVAGTVTMANVIVSSNTAQGGAGGSSSFSTGYGQYANGAAGGSGYGGGVDVAAGTVTATNTTVSANTSLEGQGGGGGGAGGNGGTGLGGGLYAAGGTITLRNDTVTSNTAQYGAGGSGSVAGSPGVGVGGGLWIDTLAAVYLDTFSQAHITNNTASTSDPNIHGVWHHI
jgi:hypothetical protein